MASMFSIRGGALAVALLGLVNPGQAVTSSTYQLETTYEGANFFDGFDFYTVRGVDG